MLIDDYNSRLNDVYTRSINCEDPLKCLPDALDSYKALIRDFFSKNGGAPIIRDLYAKVEDPKTNNQYQPTEAIDILKGSDLFLNNFFPGMTGYICDRVVPSEQGLPVKERLETMVNETEPFILSIFGGEKNPPIKTCLGENLNMLEHLIDFIGRLDDLKIKTETYRNILYPKISDPSVALAAKLYCKSVSFFAYQYVLSMLKNMTTIIKTFSPKPFLKKEVEETPAFKLFD